MRNHLQFHWWKYAIVILLPIILWTSIFSSLKAPAPEQRVHILYVGQSLDTERLQNQLTAALPELTTQQLKAVTVTTADTTPLSYDTLDVRCFDYDILLFEESSMPENVGQAVFVRLTEALLAQLPDTRVYQEDVAEAGVLTYGFVISPNAQTRLSDCYRGNQNCYLFISPRSVNFDTLNENGRAGNDAGLKAAQFLLEKP